MTRGAALAAALLVATLTAAGAGSTGPAAAAGGSSAAGALGPAGPPVRVTDITGPEGGPIGGPSGVLVINEAGQVGGTAQVTGADGRRRPVPVRWEHRRATVLVPDGRAGYLADLDDDGDAAITELAGGPALRPSIWRRGRWSPLVDAITLEEAHDVDGRGRVLGSGLGGPTPGWHPTVWRLGAAPVVAPDALRSARELNDAGLVVGVVAATYTTEHAATWQVGGGVTDLGTLGGPSSRALAVNESGHVAGGSDTVDGEEHAVLWRDGTTVDLGTLGGDRSWVGGGYGPPLYAQVRERTALNERGDVVGASTTAAGDTHAVLWAGGEAIDLGTLGGASSEAVAVNRHRLVVGVSDTASGARQAFAWRDGTMVDLGLAAGATSSVAVDVNDRGQVLGLVQDADGTTRTVLWTLGR